MLKNPSIRTILITWAAWVLIVIAFQALAVARFQPKWPDRALDWTETETSSTYQNDKPYLLGPFMNQQVAWDSEFYLAIAVGGYDDPKVRSISVPGTDQKYSLSYSFMPFYPFAIRLVAWLPRLLGMEPIAAATLSGVALSALGSLLGMLALYDLAREELGEAGGLRAAFYLILFPTGFFLLQIYTEGLFVGLAFASLALMRRRRFLWAALLAALATWTRAVGVALIIPLLIIWFQEGWWMDLDLEWRQIYFKGLPWKDIGRGLVFFTPLLAYLAWNYSYMGRGFQLVEEFYFRRGFLSLGTSFYNWSTAFSSIFSGNSARSVYYMIEFGGILLGLVACFAVFRRYPGLAAFSLAVVLISLTSGPAQGMHRYILTAPAVFIFLSRLGKKEAFDRAWTLGSVLLMGLMAMLFAFDFWVA